MYGTIQFSPIYERGETMAETTEHELTELIDYAKSLLAYFSKDTIRINTKKKQELLNNLIENFDYTDSTGIIASEHNFLRRCDLIQLQMAYLENPEFVLDVGFSAKQSEIAENANSQYTNCLYGKVTELAAQRLEIDAAELAPEKIKDAPEEYREALDKAYSEIETQRTATGWFSNYNIARSLIQHDAMAALDCRSKETKIPYTVNIKTAAALYFFALNPSINPFDVSGDGVFSATYGEKLAKLYDAFYNFYFARDGIKTTRKLIESFAKDVSARTSLQTLGQVEELAATYSSPTIHALASLRTIGALDPFTNAVPVDDVLMQLKDFKNIGVGADKLLKFSLSLFTRKNSKGVKNPTLRVYGDTRAYARANGIKIDPEKKDTPEAQRKENARAKKALMNFLAKLKRDAENLKSNVSYSFEADIKGRGKTYAGLNLVGYYGIDSNAFMIEFTQKAAEYFVSLPVGYTPASNYLIEDKHINAYAIYDAMLTHYSQDNAVLHNSERVLKISNILKHTSYSIEKCREKRWSWEHHIKDEFEKDLEYLYKKAKCFAPEVFDQDGQRVSGGYFYCKAGKKEITDAQMQAGYFSSYEQFASTYLYFELSGFAPHADRVEYIRARNEAAKKKNSLKHKKNSNAKKTSPEGSAKY